MSGMAEVQGFGASSLEGRELSTTCKTNVLRHIPTKNITAIRPLKPSFTSSYNHANSTHLRTSCQRQGPCKGSRRYRCIQNHRPARYTGGKEDAKDTEEIHRRDEGREGHRRGTQADCSTNDDTSPMFHVWGRVDFCDWNRLLLRIPTVSDACTVTPTTEEPRHT